MLVQKTIDGFNMNLNIKEPTHLSHPPSCVYVKLSFLIYCSLIQDELFPDWKELGAPIETKAGEDKFIYLTSPTASTAVPNMLLPPQLHNDGNYIISLSQLTRWLGEKAEELGVEIYPGFAADEVLYRLVVSSRTSYLSM